MALDVGTVRIGVAKSDGLGIMAQPLITLQAQPEEEMFSAILRLVQEHDIQEIVVGYPKHLNGTIGPSAKLAEAFVEKLKTHATCPVTLWDERMTSAASQRLLIDRGMRREKRKAVVDQLAAVLILQNYLDAKRSRGGG